MTVDEKQRYTASDPCPICGGYPGEARGNGHRCHGFYSSDGMFALCSREELAGEIQAGADSGTYPHLLIGECSCGSRHGEPGKAGNGRGPSLGPVLATYDYVDLAGAPVHRTVRYEPKDFRQYRYEDGEWLPGLKGVSRILYNLPVVMRAILDGEMVAIMEGEKDVHTATNMGLAATTCAEGAGKWRSEYNYLFRGADVVLVPDNDDKGREHMEKIGSELLPIAKTVSMVDLPGLPEGGDLSNWVESGGTKEAFLQLSLSPYTVHQGEGERWVKGYVGFGAYRIAELDPPGPRRYLIHNILEPGKATYLYGAAATLKSLIGCMLCISVASSDVDEIFSHAVEEHGPAVIFDSELDVEELQRRVRQLCAGMGISIPQDLYYVSAVGVAPEESFTNLLDLGNAMDALLVNIDSLGFATMGDPEAYKDVKRHLRDYIGPLRAEGIAPLIIDHKPHQGDNLFGSVAKTFHGRYIFQTEDLDGEDRTPGIRNVRVTNRKASFGDQGRRFALRFKFEPKDGPITATLHGSPTAPPPQTRETVIQRSLKAGDKTREELTQDTEIPKSSLENILPAMVEKRMVHVPHKRGKANLYRGGPPPGDLPSNVHLLPNAHSREKVRVEKKGPQLVTDDHGISQMVEALEPVAELGVDVETYPQDESARSLDPRRGKVGVITLSSGPSGETYVIDRKSLSEVAVREALLTVLDGKTIVAHNAPFDLAFLRRDVGYEHNGPVYDTLVLDAMLFYATGPLTDKESWRGFISRDKQVGYKKPLSDIAEKRIGVTLDKTEQQSDWGGSLSEEMVSYAAEDTSVLLALKDALLSELEGLGMGEVVDLESRFTPAMAYTSDNGFALDVEGWKKHAAGAAAALEEARLRCDELAPEPPEEGWVWSWNASNHRKVGKALELLGAKVEKKSASGNYITGEDALKAIKRPKRAKALVDAILSYRAHEKYVTTWGDNWFEPPEVVTRGKTKGKIKQGSPRHLQVVDGRVHSWMNQLMATGRGSSKSPNLQNLPEDLRHYFVAPEGRKLLVADYSQMEYVAAAWISGDEALLGPMRGGADYHELTAGMIGADRAVAKMVNFAILYGMGKKSLAQRIGVSEKKAQGFIDAIFERAPALGVWIREQGERARRGAPYAKTPIGRIRLIDQNYRSHTETWESKRSQMLNHPIQGGCADGYKLAAAMVFERRGEFSGRPLLMNMIHDELVVEVDEESAEVDAALLDRIMVEGMQQAIGKDAPVGVDVEIADTWTK